MELLNAESPLPSWAPDWSGPIRRPFAKYGQKSYFRYSTSENSQSLFNFVDKGDGHLVIDTAGIYVDTVLALGDSTMECAVSDLTRLDHGQDPDYQSALRWLMISRPCQSIAKMLMGVSDIKDTIRHTSIGDMEFAPEGKHQRVIKALEKCYELCQSGNLRAVIDRVSYALRKRDLI